MASQARIHGAVLAVFGARSFEQLIQIVTTDLAVLLDADVATIAVESAEPMKRRPRNHHGVQILEARHGRSRCSATTTTWLLLDDIAGDPELFGDGAGLVRSAALLRLRVSAKAPAGLLASARGAPGKFHAGARHGVAELPRPRARRHHRAWLDLPA